MPVQQVDYAALRRRLLRDRAVLEWPPPPPGLSVEAPELRPGVGATVKVTLTNDDVEAYEGVALSLAAPDWTVAPASPAEAERLEPGDSFEAAWTVTAPVQPEPAAAGDLQVGARYAVAGAPVERSAVEPAYVVEPAGPPWSTAASTEAHIGARDGRLAIIAGGADLWDGVDQYGALFRDGGGAAGTVATVAARQPGPDRPERARRDRDAQRPRRRRALSRLRPGRGEAAGGFLLLWDADGSGTVESVARAGSGPTPSPAWLRLTRSGTTFTGAYSPDGTAWTTIGTCTVPTAAAVQDVGLVCCSHSTTELGRAVFDRFIMTS